MSSLGFPVSGFTFSVINVHQLACILSLVSYNVRSLPYDGWGLVTSMQMSASRFARYTFRIETFHTTLVKLLEVLPTSKAPKTLRMLVVFAPKGCAKVSQEQRQLAIE